MQLIDSHCHLHHLEGIETAEDLLPVLAAARQLGVAHMLCVAIDLSDCPKIMAIAERYPNVSAAVGVHPTKQGVEPSVDELVALASAAKIVAVGETGLDYYRPETDRRKQQARFRYHIQAARQVNKPLIIHTRAAQEDTIRLLKEEKADAVGGVLHCFTEGWEMAEAALDLGFYISLSGIVTFKNATALQEVAKRLPLERLLIETDSPYLAPVPFRGKPNQPAYVRYVAEYLSQLLDIPLTTLAQITTENFYRLFKGAAPEGSQAGIA